MMTENVQRAEHKVGNSPNMQFRSENSFPFANLLSEAQNRGKESTRRGDDLGNRSDENETSIINLSNKNKIMGMQANGQPIRSFRFVDSPFSLNFSNALPDKGSVLQKNPYF